MKYVTSVLPVALLVLLLCPVLTPQEEPKVNTPVATIGFYNGFTVHFAFHRGTSSKGSVFGFGLNFLNEEEDYSGILRKDVADWLGTDVHHWSISYGGYFSDLWGIRTAKKCHGRAYGTVDLLLLLYREKYDNCRFLSDDDQRFVKKTTRILPGFTIGYVFSGRQRSVDEVRLLPVVEVSANKDFGGILAGVAF